MSEWVEGEAQADTIRIHYHRTNRDHKPAVVLLHGLSDNGLCWSRVARDLEGSHDVIMPDARGHGHSDRIANEFSIDLLASDAAALIQELDLACPYVFGHSMGAITAAVLAAEHPTLVRAIVLEDPPIGEGLRPPDAGPAALRRFSDLRALPREERLKAAMSENADWPPEENIPWSDSKVEFDVAVLEHREAFRAVNWRAVFSRIQCPGLLLVGDPECGALVTPKVADEASQLWPDGEVSHISGAGHSIHRDRYEETMYQVRQFLREH